MYKKNVSLDVVLSRFNCTLVQPLHPRGHQTCVNIALARELHMCYYHSNPPTTAI